MYVRVLLHSVNWHLTGNVRVPRKVEPLGRLWKRDTKAESHGFSSVLSRKSKWQTGEQRVAPNRQHASKRGRRTQRDSNVEQGQGNKAF